MELSQTMIPPELLNNLGVLMLEDDREEEALNHLQEALTNCENLLSKGQSDDKRLLALRLHIKFNLACCHDKASRIGEASEMFKSIIKQEPSYTDAYMRLAYLAERRGDLKRAIEYIEQGKQNHNRDTHHSLPTKLFCMKGRFLTD